MRLSKKIDLKKRGFFTAKGVKKEKWVVCNDTVEKKKMIFRHLLRIDTPYVRVNSRVNSAGKHNGVEIRLITVDRKWISEPIELNSETLITLNNEYGARNYLLYINLPAGTSFSLEMLTIEPWSNYTILKKEDFGSDILLITPMYPSMNNPYSATFVYSKVKKYLEFGINPDIVVATNNEKRLYRYNYKGDIINKVSFDDLRNIIQTGHYTKILVHFLDRQIGNALLACDLDRTEIVVYCHGADVDLWNPNIFTGYFEPDHVFTQDENVFRYDRLDVLREFEKRKNVKWIFNTKWNYENTKAVVGLSFDNHEIIPCVIDEDEFAYINRDDGKKYNVLVLKKMDNVRQYAVDLAVRIITRLSDKEYFNKMHFTVAGAGDYQTELMHPLRKYNNVTIVDRFYDHSEINGVFREHGILLAPSRYDTQGVTVGEGAMSGMVVISSSGTGVSDMLPEELGTFFNNDSIEDAVNIIDDIITGKKRLSVLSREFHDAISESASRDKVMQEAELIKQAPIVINRLVSEEKKGTQKNKPILTIVIPAYNASQYIENTIKSMVNHRRLDLLEIIVVNDGSMDDTVKVVKRIRKESSPAVRDAIVLVDKENGGHGSTINVGLKKAKGKYFRIVDADDRLDSAALEKHLEYLSKTDVDIVFTNTIHDLSVESIFVPDHKYDFMVPHVEYNFDELCEEYYGFRGYGPVLSTTSTKTERLREVGCRLTEKSFYVDIEYNYYMTEAAMTAALDPVDLYYYYLGRDGQSLSMESYKRNFSQHLRVLESVIELLEKNRLSALKYEHFVRVQLHETIFHQYRIALEMFNSFKKFKQVEKVLERYPKYYRNDYLTPEYVKRMRKYGFPYYIVRKMAIGFRPKMRAIKHLIKRV